MKWIHGFVMLGLSLPAAAQYAGPAILSRGEAPAAMTLPSVDFAFSLTVASDYSNGLVGISAPNVQGQLPNKASFGMTATLGLSGAHSWKHTHIGLAYGGSFYDYFQASYFAGLSQGLSFGLSHQFTRHILFDLRENVGLYTLFPPATVSLNSAVPFDPSQSYIPTTDFYDNRTIYNTTQADVTLQATTRLSFQVGGAYFTNLRRSSDLYGAEGEVANGDVQYRISRRSTIGARYTYGRFTYTNSEGGAFVHTAAVTGSFRISRWTELSFFGGAARVSSTFIQLVPLDPSILEALCPPNLVASCPYGPEPVHANSVFWGPDFGLRLSRSFHRGVAYLSAGESITPGNGLFLTSRTAFVSGGYGYSGLRKWSLNLGVTYSRSLSLGNIQGSYGEVTGSYSMSRQILGRLSFVSSFMATQYQSSSFAAYNRLIYSASAGLGFSSKDIPVRLF